MAASQGTLRITGHSQGSAEARKALTRGSQGRRGPAGILISDIQPQELGEDELLSSCPGTILGN